jgi:hypothetical protein
MRIARDLMADLMRPESPDVFILASGDRDFNEVSTPCARTASR